MYGWSFVAAVVALVFGLTASGNRAQDPWAETSTFLGRIPCASCPGIDLALQLKPDGTFFLQSTYLEAEDGEARTSIDMGRWALTVDDEILVLSGGSEGVRRWSVVAVDTLQMLDSIGNPIASETPHELVRTSDDRHLSATTHLSGMYLYMADAALFEECRTRKRYPVEFEEAHIELEGAYLSSRIEPGQWLMAEFDGRMELRPVTEGMGFRETVIVSAFRDVFPAKACGVDASALEGTQWNLIEINGRPIEIGDRSRIPQLVFSADENRVTGSGGCNHFSAGYHATADSLTFGPAAMTMMACPDGMDMESAFMQVLAASTNMDQYRNILELWSGRRILAILEATEPDTSPD